MWHKGFELPTQKELNAALAAIDGTRPAEARTSCRRAIAFGRELSKHAVKGKDKKTNVVTWSGIRLTG